MVFAWRLRLGIKGFKALADSNFTDDGKNDAKNDGKQVASAVVGSMERALPELDRQLCFAIYSTAHAFNAVYTPLLKKLGLTYPQFLVMLTLTQTDALTVSAIGDRLYLDSGTLTPLLKRMEKAGLIQRKRGVEDERCVHISLTKQGQALQDKALGVPEVVIGGVGEHLTSNQMLLGGILEVRRALKRIASETSS